MKTFNFDIDECFDAACHSLGKEMGNSSNISEAIENSTIHSSKTKKKRRSFYKRFESVCLIILVKLFI